MVAEELKIVIKAESAKAQKSLKGVETQTKKASSEMGKMSSLLKKGLGFGLAAVSAGKLIGAVKESIDLYGQQVQAEQKLASAIRSTGGDVDELLPRYKDLASSIQGVTTVGDESTLALIQQAKSMGIADDQIEEATKGAIGLSKAFGMNTQQSIKGVANAMQGNFQTLQRYIPALRNANNDAEKMEIVQKAMADGFDTAKAEADNSYGSIQQLGNSYGDLQEQLGQTVADGMRPFVDALNDIATQMAENISAAREYNRIILKGEEERTIQEQISLQKTKVEQLRSQIDLQSKVKGGADSILGSFKNSTDELDNQLRSAENILGNLIRRQAEQDNLTEKQKEGTEAGEDAVSHLDNLKKAYSETVDGQRAAIQEQITYFETFKQGPMATAVLRDLREELDKLSEKTQEVQERNLGTLVAIGDRYFQNEEAAKKWMQSTQDEFASMTASNIEKIQQQKETYIQAGVDRVEAERLASEQIKEIQEQEFQQKVDYALKYVAVAQNIASSLATISSNNYQQQINDVQKEYEDKLEIAQTGYEDQIEETTEHYDKLIAKAKEGSDEEKRLQKEKQNAIDAIKEESAQKQSEISEEQQRKEKQLMREQAKDQKKWSIFQATINGAVAVTKTMTSVPFPANVPLAALQATAAGLQIAAIKSQPLPQLAEGGLVTSETQAVMGEGGKKEAVLPLEDPRAMDRIGRAIGDAMARNGGSSRGGGGPMRVTVNLDKRAILEAVSKGSDNGEVIINSRSVR